ncbi:MAG: LuxR C-terminal-related transcriptional regulator [Actinomycetota bacterium]|nr:LuxR C-terminal-related transcriptional regulator [Actinomycetota bacterium]
MHDYHPKEVALIDASIASQRDLLMVGLRQLPRRTGCPIAFGGLVLSDGAPLDSFVGTHGRSLNGLLIEPTHGVGGLALSDRRPVATAHYRHSAAITHRYDREVTAEGIVSLLAVPVVVDNRVHAIIYVAARQATEFGDTVVREAMRTARGLAWEFSVAAEVDRRLALLETDGRLGPPVEGSARERQELRDAFAELRELGRAVADPEIAERLEAVARIVMPDSAATPRAGEAPAPSPRELDMLAQLALGKRNAQIGSQLGLTEATVKSYVSSVMRKLGASSRYEAVIAARRAGLIP